MIPTDTTFPRSFLWGAASSAFQVEGAAAEDGRGPSVWDAFCHKPGTIFENHTADTACDHYHRYEGDVALMQRIGLRAYRFSVSWSRVLPSGTGDINEKGLAFYDRLVDALLEANITPWLTLFHWDFPLALHEKGAWLNRESPEWFADYTRVIVDRLSDRVTHWMTHNEPQCFIAGGPDGLQLPPGFTPTLSERLLMTHHALMAHGRAVQVIREHAKKKPSVGWAMVGVTHTPADDLIENIEAARTATTTVVNRDLWNNAWYADAAILGHYPESGLRVYGADAPKPRPGDMELIHQPLDFYGLNIYHAIPTAPGKDGAPVTTRRPAGMPRTAFGWPVEPESLYWGPRFHHERYKLPVYITENGLSSMDWVTLDGAVHDANRIDFTRRYLLALHRAIADRVDVRGYFHWSILDNFEWLDGYKQRFGLIHVDYATQKRTLKDSAHWYRGVIESNGASLAENPFKLMR